MHQMVQFYLLLIIQALVSSYSFNLRVGWTLRGSLKANHAKFSMQSQSASGKEVFVGNLPPNTNEQLLHELLSTHNVSDCETLCVLPYKDEQDVYGTVTYRDTSLADRAANSLHNSIVHDYKLDSAVMIGSSRLFARLPFFGVRNQDIRSLLYERDSTIDDVSVSPHSNGTNIHIRCPSEPHARRCMARLAGLRYNGFLMNFKLSLAYGVKPHGIILRNLHPYITYKDLRRMLHEIFGDDHVQMISYPVDQMTLRGSGKAFVYFASQEQACKAISVLDGKMLVNQVVSANIDGRLLTSSKETASLYGMYLGNVSAPMSVEAVKQLCTDVLADSGSSIALVKRNRSKRSGQPVDTCLVYFRSLEARSRCISHLNGKVWNGTTLIASEMLPLGKTNNNVVVISNLLASWSDEAATTALQDLLGPDCKIKKLLVLRAQAEKYSKAFLHMHTESDAKTAVGLLNGVSLHGETLYAKHHPNLYLEDPKHQND